MEMKFTHEEVGFQFKKLGLADSRTQTLPGSDTAAEPRLLFRSARLSTIFSFAASAAGTPSNLGDLYAESGQT